MGLTPTQLQSLGLDALLGCLRTPDLHDEARGGTERLPGPGLLVTHAAP